MEGGLKKARFRRRGGVNKKKPRSAPGGSHDADNYPTVETPKFDKHAYSAQNASTPNQQFEARQEHFHQRGDMHKGSGGRAGRGKSRSRGSDYSTLDGDLLSYLRKLREDLTEMSDGRDISDPSWMPSNPLDDEEPAPPILLARNGLSSLQPRLHEIARDGEGSRMLEVLVRLAGPSSAAAALSALQALGSQRLAVLAQHHIGSHVLEKIIVAAANSQSTEDDEDAVGALGKAVSEWDVDTLMHTACNSCGSHVLRALMAALAGLPVEEPRGMKLDDSDAPAKIKSYIEKMAHPTPEKWRQAIVNVVRTLLSEKVKPELNRLLYETAFSAFLQAVLASASVACLDDALRLADAAIAGEFWTLVHNACGSRFVECVVVSLGVAPVSAYLKGRLHELATHPKGNFVAQRVLISLKGRGAVNEAWNELEKDIPAFLGVSSARTGVLLALLRATEAEGDNDSRRRANKAVGKALGTTGPGSKDLLGALLTGSAELWASWRENVKQADVTGMGIRGSIEDVLRLPRGLPHFALTAALMARCLLRYPGPASQNARDGMSALNATELLALIADVHGSRVVEQWVEVQDESRKHAGKVIVAILKAGKTGPVAVARSPYGAQIISKVLPLANPDIRKKLLNALAESADVLKEHQFGVIVVRKCRLLDFKRTGQWAFDDSRRDSRKRIFKEVFEEGEKVTKRRRGQREAQG